MASLLQSTLNWTRDVYCRMIRLFRRKSRVSMKNAPPRPVFGSFQGGGYSRQPSPSIRIINPRTELHAKAWSTVHDLMSFSVNNVTHDAFVREFNELIGFLVDLGPEGRKIAREASGAFVDLVEQYKLLAAPGDGYDPSTSEYVHKKVDFASKLKEHVFALCPLTAELYWPNE